MPPRNCGERLKLGLVLVSLCWCAAWLARGVWTGSCVTESKHASPQPRWGELSPIATPRPLLNRQAGGAAALGPLPGPSVTSQPKTNATTATKAAEDSAILLLVRDVTDKDMLETLRLLGETCPFARRTPIYLLITPYASANGNSLIRPDDVVPLPRAPLIRSQHAAGTSSDSSTDSTVLDVRILDVSKWFLPPAAAILDRAKELHPKYSWTWQYRAMCNFWATQVFQVPEIAALKFVMRLDADSRLECHEPQSVRTEGNTAEAGIDSASRYDPFEHLKQHEDGRGAVYSYWKFSYDHPGVVSQFSRFVDAFARNVSMVDLKMSEISSNNRPPMFYNNFEVLFVPFFRSNAVARFNQALARTNGVWLHRWGDACIRFAQVRMFAAAWASSKERSEPQGYPLALDTAGASSSPAFANAVVCIDMQRHGVHYEHWAVSKVGGARTSASVGTPMVHQCLTQHDAT